MPTDVDEDKDAAPPGGLLGSPAPSQALLRPGPVSSLHLHRQPPSEAPPSTETSTPRAPPPRSHGTTQPRPKSSVEEAQCAPPELPSLQESPTPTALHRNHSCHHVHHHRSIQLPRHTQTLQRVFGPPHSLKRRTPQKPSRPSQRPHPQSRSPQNAHIEAVGEDHSLNTPPCHSQSHSKGMQLRKTRRILGQKLFLFLFDFHLQQSPPLPAS